MINVCRHCGKGPNEIQGWLARVNEKGVPGIWECRPMCGADLPPEERVIGAIEGGTSDDLRGKICRIVSRMLDNPDGYGIYPTAQCYDELEALCRPHFAPAGWQLVPDDPMVLQRSVIVKMSGGRQELIQAGTMVYPAAPKEPK